MYQNVTVGLALENAIKDAIDADCDVIIYSPNTDANDKLARLGINELIPDNQFAKDRVSALNHALAIIEIHNESEESQNKQID